MSRLSKRQASLHAQACALLDKDKLRFDEKLFVLEHFQESANHVNCVAGAFFTPQGLARELSIEVGGNKVIDLCAGIGALAFAVYHFSSTWSGSEKPEITCVEINPDYVAVGRKILPEATWVVADVLDLPPTLTGFDCAIANPPFGRIASSGRSPRYTGADFEYKVVDVASDIAKYGTFLIIQSSSPFKLSGVQSYEETRTSKYEGFSTQTSIDLTPNCGIDTTISNGEWHNVSVVTEIVLADFTKTRARRQPEIPVEVEETVISPQLLLPLAA
jgi:predicted RNA methylase